MRRWGFVITVFYVMVVAILLVPGLLVLVEKSATDVFRFNHLLTLYRDWFPWVCVGIATSGQALLLFLSVDTSWRRLRPRQHIAVTALLTGFFAALLVSAAIWSLFAGVYGDPDWPIWEWRRSFPGDLLLESAAVFAAFWISWGTLFYVHYRGSSNVVVVAVSWLLRGSVLELLIAVPAHVVVRQRGDCSAPLVTGFGIVTGIAVMLLCFGPGVLALYKKKFEAYRKLVPKQR